MQCESDEVIVSITARMFRMKLIGSALTLFDFHFAIENSHWPQVNALVTEQFDSQIKKGKVSDKIAGLKITTVRKDEGTEKNALSRLFYGIATRNPLALPQIARTLYKDDY